MTNGNLRCSHDQARSSRSASRVATHCLSGVRTGVPALRSGMKNAAPRPGYEASYGRRQRFNVSPLDIFSYLSILIPIPSHWRERYLGRFGTWGWERRLRAGANVALRHREALGFRPGPLRGSATDVAGRGQAAARNRRSAKSPEERTGVLKNAVTERREALPCASVSRRSGKQAAAVTKVRLSAFRLPLFLSRARSPETPIHAKEFAGSDDACPEQGLCKGNT